MSFDFTYCLECPEGGICHGGTSVEVKNGYWRPYNISEDIVACKNKAENCIRTYGTGNEICRKGHIGPLCEECDIEG